MLYVGYLCKKCGDGFRAPMGHMGICHKCIDIEEETPPHREWVLLKQKNNINNTIIWFTGAYDKDKKHFYDWSHDIIDDIVDWLPLPN
jgi:hypothetical protein